MDFPFISIPWEVQTKERVVGRRVKAGICVFPSISSLLAGIVSTHLANPGLMQHDGGRVTGLRKLRSCKQSRFGSGRHACPASGWFDSIGVEIFYSLTEPISRSRPNWPNHCRETLQAPEVAAALKTAEILTISAKKNDYRVSINFTPRFLTTV